MTTKEALKIKESLCNLADFMEVTPQAIVSNICFLDQVKFDKFKEASLIWNEFEDADIFKRGEMLGIKIEKGESLLQDNLESKQ